MTSQEVKKDRLEGINPPVSDMIDRIKMPAAKTSNNFNSRPPQLAINHNKILNRQTVGISPSFYLHNTLNKSPQNPDLLAIFTKSPLLRGDFSLSSPSIILRGNENKKLYNDGNLI